MKEAAVDLVIKNGTVITSGSRFVGDVGIRDGKVAQLGGEITAGREIDASGKLVIPGGIDIHVHLERAEMLTGEGEPRMVDDVYTGTVGAAVGGVTTVGNMIHPEPGERLTPFQLLERAEPDALANSVIDFTQHPVITYPSAEVIEQIPDLVGAGYSSLKIFTDLGFQKNVAEFARVLETAGRSGVLPMIHCEDWAIDTYLENRLNSEGKSDVTYYSASRPGYAEATATVRAMAASRAAGNPMYVVHLSSAAALEETRRARISGQPVYVETRPIYLYYTSAVHEESDGAKYTGWPPLREDADVDALWEGLNLSDIHTFASDHAPWTLDQKLDADLKVGTFRPGMANLETLMSMLYSEGVRKGRISMNRFVELTSTNPAKLFGMYPQKGTIAAGSDADIAIWDPAEEHVLSVETTHMRTDYIVYEGMPIRGKPKQVWLRGRKIVDGEDWLGQNGAGRYITRRANAPVL
jgi:dihydropyrimidinase